MTGDSNSTQNHLLTFTGRTTSGKQFIFLRVWIHNQRQSSFRWVFGVVLKTFIPTEFHEKVELVLVDGDKQQQAELFNAVQSYLTKATVGSCMFHIVQQNWKNNGTSNCLLTRNYTYYNATVKTLHNWIHSFADLLQVQDQDEYIISKKLLFAYLHFPEALNVMEHKRNITKIHQWIIHHVVIYDQHFLAYLKKGKRTYYQKTTSPHEGTNLGIKEHADNCGPSQKLLRSAKALALQSDLKTMQIGHSATIASSKTMLWTDSKEHQHLVTKCVSLLMDVQERCLNYCACRIGPKSWEVIHKSFVPHVPKPNNFAELVCEEELHNLSQEASTNSPIPRFWRIHTVTLDSDNCLKCSCCVFETTGIPCAHQACVMNTSISDWKGFTCHDVSIEWWNLWYEHAYKDSTIGQNLLALASVPVSGPYFPINHMEESTTSFRASTQLPPAAERVVNHNTEKVCDALQQQESAWEGLSQESHMPSDNDFSQCDTYLDHVNTEIENGHLMGNTNIAFPRFVEPPPEVRIKASEKHRGLFF